MESFVTQEFINIMGLAEAEETIKNMGYDYAKKQVLRSMVHQAHKEALLKSLKSRLHIYYEEYLDSEEFLASFPIFKDCKDKVEKFNTRYIFLTVNPEPTITLKMFRDICEKAISKVWINNYIYVIEQRGNNDEEIGRGFHAHFIIDKEEKKHHEAVRELKNTFKKVCDVSYSCVFNIRNIKVEQLSRFIKYICGIKAQEFKQPKQLIDVKFRDINHIAAYYAKGELVKMINEEKECVFSFED